MIENLTKFEIAEKIKELKSLFSKPEGFLFNLSQRFGVYDEVLNMPTDKEGGVPLHYVSDTLKSFLRLYEDIKANENCEKPVEDIFTDDFYGTLFTKKYGKQ